MKRTVTLCFSGLDPSGGAGLQADIESVMAAGSHAAVICTALTIQTSQQVFGFESVNSELIQKQALHLIDDLPIYAYKTGMLGSLSNLKTIGNIIKQYPRPYVLDPVMVANSGDRLGNEEELRQGFISLLPLTTLITPNTIELRSLTGEQNLDKAAQKLCHMGAHAVLVKGGHEPTADIRHKLYIKAKLVSESFWPRLAGEYHGTGCSLASFIAGRLARLKIKDTSQIGEAEIINAVQLAEVWLSQTIQTAFHPHVNGQAIPNRHI